MKIKISKAEREYWRSIDAAFDALAEDWSKRTGKSKYAFTIKGTFEEPPLLKKVIDQHGKCMAETLERIAALYLNA